MNSTFADYYDPVILSATDYYPFGMEMPSRTLASGGYRYGFNGKEKDTEGEWGTQTHYDYGFRIYEPGIGRFLSVDPLSSSFPWYTPYQFAGNKPIWAIDLDGLEELIYQFTLKDGKATLLKKIDNIEVRNDRGNGLWYYKKSDGKAMTQEDFGKVQYQYFDENGKRLHIRRNLNGEYVKGENELMDIGDNNMFGSIYIGPDNPEFEGGDDYRREPQDEVDAAALQHDQAYGKKKVSGLNGALHNRDVRPADVDLVNAANKVIKKRKDGGIDVVTGQKVTKKTANRAKRVAQFFNWVLKGPKPKKKREKVYPKPMPKRL